MNIFKNNLQLQSRRPLEEEKNVKWVYVAKNGINVS